MPISLSSAARQLARCAAIASVTVPLSLRAQELGPDVRAFVRVDAPTVALTHVRVVDGTGSPAREDQTIVIAGGKIASVGAAGAAIPAGAQVLDLAGYTIIPGLVGMHDHMFYTSSLDRDSTGRSPAPGQLAGQEGFSFPRLYLAAGVTTVRTTGSMEPYMDLNLKMQIDDGRAPGPRMYISAPYLEGKGTPFPQMHELTGADDARKFVDYWADQGATSFKGYTHLTRAELGAAIAEAHKRGTTLTAHLCSIGYHDAVALGIDDLEHGPVGTDADYVPGKKPDVCPAAPAIFASWVDVPVPGPAVDSLIHELVSHHVAITSTLPVYELSIPDRPPLQKRMLDAMSPESRVSYLTMRARGGAMWHGQPLPWGALMAKEMAFELEFVRAGGLLLTGPDPTGIGGVLAGFGDQRGVELLVEGGFTPLEAIHIATANGSQFLGAATNFGTITAGKQADLVVIKGDPSTRITDIENVEIVFKGGIGYDSAKLIQSVRGVVGIR
jgi:imidazolonepropionase-like amidohydrolase